jgi:capsular exopolysaccharide synthesis family protein
MEETTYNFGKFIRFLQQKAWLLALGLLLGAGLGFVASKMISPVYQTTTKVMITRAGQSQSPDFTTYLSDLQLTQTYVQLLTTETVLKPASDRLGIKLKPEDVDVRAVPDTQIIVLRVVNGNPQRAALIANTVIEVLMEQNEIIQSGHYDAVEQSLRLQKMQTESAIQDLQNQIRQATAQSLDDQKVWFENQLAALQIEKASLQQEILQIGTANTPETRLLLNQKNARLDQIQSLNALYQDNYNDLLLVYDSPVEKQINPNNSQLTLLTTAQALYQQYYASILDELESIHLARLQNVPNIVQIEVAWIPEQPIRPIPWLNMVLGAMVGLVLMTGITLLQEALDGTLKTKEAIERLLGAPVIGFVDEIPRKEDIGKNYVAQEPYSLISEDFRLLRANLELASAEKLIHTILITSPQDSDGKTTIAINLATMLAQAGKQVALLEADMRHPQLQTRLGFSDVAGLSTVLTEHTSIEMVSCASTDAQNLLIIPAGKPSCNAAELLSSEKMSQLLSKLEGMVDLVVIDSPPSFIADAQILASKVDAVLFVVRPGVTCADAAQGSMETFKRTGARIVGIVMNGIPHNQSFYHRRKKYLFQN